MPIRKHTTKRLLFGNKDNKTNKNETKSSDKSKENKKGSRLKGIGPNAINNVKKESEEKFVEENKKGEKEPLEQGSDSEKNVQKDERTSSSSTSKGMRKKTKLPPKPYFPQIQIRGDSVVEVDLEKNTVKSRICPKIEITEIRRNIDTKEVSMILEFDYYGQTYNIEIDRSYFEKRKLMTLQKYGVGVYDFNANNVIKHLVNQEILAKKTYMHSLVGMVKEKDGTYTFRHYKAQGEDFTSTYSGNLKLKPKGTKEEKLKMIQEHILGKIPLETIMAVAFSSALVGMISEDTEIDNPIIHLSGDSTTGKTTALMFAASLYGSPNPKEKGIFSTWNATQNAMIAKLRDNRGILAVFDEASMSKIKDFSDVIYMLAAGSDKERLNNNAEIKERKEWTTTILSNGEHSLTSKSNENTGIMMRILEFNNIVWTESAEHSDAIKKGVLENYGHLGVEFGNALIDMGKKEVIKLFRCWIDKCYDRMDKNDKFSKRLSKPMALIMASAEIARDKLGINLNLEEILDFLIKTQSSNKRSKDIGMRAYEYFLDIYTINSSKFLCSDEMSEIPKEIWGKHVRKKGKPDEILIMTSVFKKVMREGSFEDVNVILNKWKDKGILDCDVNRYTRKRSINGVSKRVYVVKITDDFFSKEEKEEAEKEEQVKKVHYEKKPAVLSKESRFNEFLDY